MARWKQRTRVQRSWCWPSALTVNWISAYIGILAPPLSLFWLHETDVGWSKIVPSMTFVPISNSNFEIGTASRLRRYISGSRNTSNKLCCSTDCMIQSSSCHSGSDSRTMNLRSQYVKCGVPMEFVFASSASLPLSSMWATNDGRDDLFGWWYVESQRQLWRLFEHIYPPPILRIRSLYCDDLLNCIGSTLVSYGLRARPFRSFRMAGTFNINISTHLELDLSSLVCSCPLQLALWRREPKLRKQS